MRSLYLTFRRNVQLSLFVVRQHSFLFFGIALFLFGVLNFSNGKYCDGNSADYYSCTNTAVYYYYGPMAITACILGSFFIAIWKIVRDNH